MESRDVDWLTSGVIALFIGTFIVIGGALRGHEMAENKATEAVQCKKVDSCNKMCHLNNGRPLYLVAPTTTASASIFIPYLCTEYDPNDTE